MAEPRPEDPPTSTPTPARMCLAVIAQPSEANWFGTLHGGVVLRLADECGALAAMRHAGGGRVTTAVIDAFTFLGPVYPGERVEVVATVVHVGRTSIECRIEVFAEPIAPPRRRTVGDGYGVYVALDDAGRPRPVPALPGPPDPAALARQAARIARREQLRQLSQNDEG